MSEVNNNIFEGFEPLQDRILVQPDEALTKTAGGIIIPKSQEEENHRAFLLW